MTRKEKPGHVQVRCIFHPQFVESVDVETEGRMAYCVCKVLPEVVQRYSR